MFLSIVLACGFQQPNLPYIDGCTYDSQLVRTEEDCFKHQEAATRTLHRIRADGLVPETVEAIEFQCVPMKGGKET